MKREELNRLTHGHHVLDDEELAKIEAARDEAAKVEPGDWRVKDDRVVRYGTWTPIVAATALNFIAMCLTWVPQLLRCVRALEDALRLAWVSANSARRELAEERERHAATVERVAKSEPGPTSDLLAIVEAIELGAADPHIWRMFTQTNDTDEEIRARLVGGYAEKLGVWARGKQLEGDLYHDVDLAYIRRTKAESDRYDAEKKERIEADMAFARALAEELKLTKAQREAHVARAQKRAEQEKTS